MNELEVSRCLPDAVAAGLYVRWQAGSLLNPCNQINTEK